MSAAVAHTGITVRDLEPAVDFWVEVLGARVERRFELGGDFAGDVTGVPGALIHAAVLELGGHRLELLEYAGPARREPPRAEPDDVAAFHLALEVADLDDTVRRCAERGWRLAGTVREMTEGPRAGTRFAYLRDPDGATLELIQPPAPHEQGPSATTPGGGVLPAG